MITVIICSLFNLVWALKNKKKSGNNRNTDAFDGIELKKYTKNK